MPVLQPQTFGDPLFMRISDGETLSEFKPRVQALLGVSDDEFARWKFCFNTSLRPTGKRASVACPGIKYFAGTVLHTLVGLGDTDAGAVKHCLACSCPPPT